MAVPGSLRFKLREKEHEPSHVIASALPKRLKHEAETLLEPTIGEPGKFVAANNKLFAPHKFIIVLELNRGWNPQQLPSPTSVRIAVVTGKIKKRLHANTTIWGKGVQGHLSGPPSRSMC